MNQERFLAELAHLLQDLPEEEREEALGFYRCYFEDAGIENEDSVISELGSPEKVAYTIKAGMQDQEEQGEYTENGYHTFEDRKSPATREENVQDQGNESDSADSQDYYRDSRKFTERKSSREEQERQQDRYADREQSHNDSLRKLILFPLWLIAVLAMICVMVAVIAVVVGVAAALGIGFAGGIVTGIAVLVIGGCVTAGGLVFPGIAVIGIGLLAFAAAFLLLLALVAFCRKPLPAAIRGICNATGAVVRSMNGKRRRKK